jgi:hypothetical protein
MYPAGNTSPTDTVVAVLGPALLAVKVKITLLPAIVALLTVLVIPTLACGTGTGVTVALLPWCWVRFAAEIVAVLA